MDKQKRDETQQNMVSIIGDGGMHINQSLIANAISSKQQKRNVTVCQNMQ